MASPKLDVEDGESMVAGFISKVWSIVNMKEYDHLVSWTEVTVPSLELTASDPVYFSLIFPLLTSILI